MQKIRDRASAAGPAGVTPTVPRLVIGRDRTVSHVPLSVSPSRATCQIGSEFEFKRIQFPVKLAFAMTINISQGPSVGAQLAALVVAYRRTAACSRVGNPRNLYVHAPDGRMKNVVYRQ
eukprot:345229-Hanusia_phi.AAC.2